MSLKVISLWPLKWRGKEAQRSTPTWWSRMVTLTATRMTRITWTHFLLTSIAFPRSAQERCSNIWHSNDKKRHFFTCFKISGIRKGLGQGKLDKEMRSSQRGAYLVIYIKSPILAVRLSLFYELYFINLKYFGMKDFLRHKLEKVTGGGQGETIQNNCQNSGN